MLVISLASVLLLVACGAAAVGGLLHARRAAASAADLAALAGAAAHRDGADGCAAAARLVALNGAVLRDCAVRGADVVVTATVPGPDWVGPDVEVPATARAGPAP